MNFYIKYNIKYSEVFDLIKQNKFRKVNFFIDLQSICTGFYNRDVVLMEIGRYATDGKISDILLQEYREYLLNLYHRFKNYDPYFITFFDDGRCLQNRTIQKDYKSGSSMDNLQVEIEHIQLFRTIKRYYFDQIYQKYNNNTAASTFYLKQYEADFIPYFCIVNNLFDAQDSDVGNFILSKDKDLLQCLKFKNTFQIVSNFLTAKKKVFFKIFDDQSAIEYIYPNFRRGFLSAKHIPLILALAGDKSDNVPGLRPSDPKKKGLGPASAVKLIQDYKLPITISELNQLKHTDKLPPIVKDNIDQLIENLKIIDFEEQLKRIPNTLLEAQ